MKTIGLIVLLSMNLFSQTYLDLEQNDIELQNILNKADSSIQAENYYLENQVSKLHGAGDITLKSFIPNAYPLTDSVACRIVFQFDGPNLELISDNNRGNGFPGFKEIFGELKFQMTCTSEITWDGVNSMTLSDAQQLVSEGYEFIHHIHAIGDGEDSYTEEQADSAIRVEKAKIDILNLGVKNASWFTGYNNIAFRSAVRKYYRSAMTTYTITGPFFNRRPVNQYRLIRFSMDSGNYNEWVNLVDKAIEQNALLIFYGHPRLDEWYTTKKDDDGVESEAGDYNWQKIGRLLTYIQSKDNYGEENGVKVETINKALDVFENVIDVGYANDVQGLGYEQAKYDFDPDREYFRVSKFGDVRSRKLDQIILSGESIKLGRRAGWLNDSTTIAIGYNAGVSGTGNYQVAIGSLAGRRNTKGYQVAIGTTAGEDNTGINQTAIGHYAGNDNTGDYQTVVGYESGRGNTQHQQSAFGFQGGYGNTGANQTAVGYQAGKNNSGEHQTVMGVSSGFGNTGIRQQAFGYLAGQNNTGDYQTAFGYTSGHSNTGLRTTTVGYYAGRQNTGARLISLGNNAGYLNTGNDVVAIGYDAGRENSESGVFLLENRNLSASNPLIKGYFASGGIVLGAPPTAVNDTLMGNSRLTFWIDEENNKLMIKVKDSFGAIRNFELNEVVE